MQKIYITTTLPYVNASPHIGFAMEIIRADILARHYRKAGYEVFFNFGTDEHGKKIYEKAVEAGKDPKAYCDEFAAKFDALKSVLNVTYNNFIRTTDEHHIMAAGEFWKICHAKGDIYKKKYQVKYCVGCELEKQDSDLVNGQCPEHPNRKLELLDEENYFFRFSKYEKQLLDLYEKNPELVSPPWRMNEIKAFVERGLQDFSISRLKAKMPWGIDVPGDNDHVMYVWFDALVNYISAIGWPDDMNRFGAWWPAVQVCGKDNLRQQTAMWQAMLMSAGLPHSKKIYVNGFIISGGQKMSKSLGNGINPIEIVAEYGTDALRFFLAREVTPFEDSDVTSERIKESYNAYLANGIGNLASRILKMSESYLAGEKIEVIISDNPEFDSFIENYQFDSAMKFVMDEVTKLNEKIQTTQPFSLYKTDPEKAKVIIRELMKGLAGVARLLESVMPATAEKISECIKANKKPETPLFLRKE
ncbi:MAG: methionine--tRNA ligase [Candidatus Paceibacterota bacterium]|jgi:methionyl-tRNA synthetase